MKKVNILSCNEFQRKQSKGIPFVVTILSWNNVKEYYVKLQKLNFCNSSKKTRKSRYQISNVSCPFLLVFYLLFEMFCPNALPVILAIWLLFIGFLFVYGWLLKMRGKMNMLILKLSTICYWIYELKASKLLYRVIFAVTF